jgi:recombinase
VPAITQVELYTVDPTVRRWDIRTGVGRAQLREAAKQAAEYSDYISEKVRVKAKHRAREGRWHGGDPGYGFNYVPAVRDGEGNVIEDEQVLVNEGQAAVVREVVRRVIANERVMAICNDLNRREIRTRDGRHWRQGNLYPILSKPAIAGLVRHPELPELVKARWDAIITEAEWRKLQAVITNPDRRQP